MARLLLTTRGLDPTGSVLAGARLGRGAQPVPRALLPGSRPGRRTGVAAWVRAYGDAVVAGAAEARAVADGVLAGSLG